MDDTSARVFPVRETEATGDTLLPRRQEVSPRRARARARVAARRNALTVVVPIQSDPEGCWRLETVLKEIGQDIRRNPHISFQALRATHFLRWVIVPGRDRRMLALEANFDGSVGEFLDDLIQVAGKTLKESLYCHCEPAIQREDPDEALKGYLLDHALPESLFYRGYPGLTVESIENDARVRALTNEYLDLPRKGRWKSASQLQEDIRRYLERADPMPRLDPEPVPWKTRLMRTRFVRTLLGGLSLPVGIPLGLALLAHEGVDVMKEKVKARLGRRSPVLHAYGDEDARRLGELLVREDFQAQNQLTHVVDLKPGLLRVPLIKLAFRYWGYLATYYFDEGKLGGIEGIHFARWVLVKDRRQHGKRRLLRRAKYQVLFFSNYDGSWESYLGSFVDRASIGLTTIWCNTVGFPRTRLWLRPFRLELGADREEAFKQWVRQHQVPTQAWFSRHPDKSIGNIVNNREIRSKVRARMSPERTREWLLCL
ncbi:hypothetical protein JRI60_02965 [Archangium violaceum]|uniref:hypothetical protein n=1 Tax=Archangium violaceum TaxID=83451 RepID=UPI00194E0631|nr:hypothetical protein [Archangium violaceum]QRN98052.1 hypothetical protein JRI60_02965 [Archangium violaceum]